MIGNDVKWLQFELNRLGFDSGEVDGALGQITSNAIFYFQIEHGLDPDAVFGPLSLGKMLELISGGKTKTYKPVKEAIASSTLIDSTGYVFRASHVIDGDIRTAWVEGADGFGLDEWIRLDFFGNENISGVEIWGGYFRDQRRFDINYRLKTAELEFSDGTRVPLYFDDVMEMQSFMFGEVSTSYVKLIIKGIYGIDVDEDTCISEIKIFGYE